MASGSYQISLRWFKPLPEGYNFNVTYKPVDQTASIKTDTGPTAFGPMFGYQAFDLFDKTGYNFDVQHVCKDDPTKKSGFVSAKTKTLDSS